MYTFMKRSYAAYMYFEKPVFAALLRCVKFAFGEVAFTQSDIGKPKRRPQTYE